MACEHAYLVLIVDVGLDLGPDLHKAGDSELSSMYVCIHSLPALDCLQFLPDFYAKMDLNLT